MTQKEQLLTLFRENDGHITLGQIMQTSLAAEYRARMTDLRHEGYTIALKRGKRPSENLYTLTQPIEPTSINFDEIGQGVWI